MKGGMEKLEGVIQDDDVGHVGTGRQNVCLD